MVAIRFLLHFPALTSQPYRNWSTAQGPFQLTLRNACFSWVARIFYKALDHLDLFSLKPVYQIPPSPGDTSDTLLR